MKNNLREYQVKAIDDLRQVIAQGHKRVVLQLATGGGKTTIAAEMIRSAVEKGKKCLFLADRIELVEQTSKRFDYEGIRHGIIMAQHPRYEPHSPVQICSPQTLARRTIPEADLIIIDECHCQYTVHKKIMEALPNAVTIGLSATPFAKGMGKNYTKLVVGATTIDLTNKGYLVPANVFAPSEPDLAKIRMIGGDYDEKELGVRLDKPQLIADIVDTWIKRGENRPTLGFAVNVLHSQHLCEKFKNAGIRAEHIDAYISKKERERIISDFKSGYCKVLFNVGILDKGFDHPEASCLIMARPTASLMLYIQQAGRVLRTHPSKENCIILDHAGNTARHGFITDELPTELDLGIKKTTPKTVSKEKKASICPSCAFVRPKNVYKCPCCGFTPTNTQDKIKIAKGELKEVTVGKITIQDKQKFYSELLYIQIEKGYREGFAANTYRNKFGVWPKGLLEMPKIASQSVRDYVKSRMIAYNNQRKRA